MHNQRTSTRGRPMAKESFLSAPTTEYSSLWVYQFFSWTLQRQNTRHCEFINSFSEHCEFFWISSTIFLQWVFTINDCSSPMTEYSSSWIHIPIFLSAHFEKTNFYKSDPMWIPSTTTILTLRRVKEGARRTTSAQWPETQMQTEQIKEFEPFSPSPKLASLR